MNEPPHARAIQAARKGEFDLAHQIVQGEPDDLSARIHAWLHRREGDLSNARYWYARASHREPELSLEEELDALERVVSAGRS